VRLTVHIRDDDPSLHIVSPYLSVQPVVINNVCPTPAVCKANLQSDYTQRKRKIGQGKHAYLGHVISGMPMVCVAFRNSSLIHSVVSIWYYVYAVAVASSLSAASPDG
jgi:hypothetical protein